MDLKKQILKAVTLANTEEKHVNYDKTVNLADE